MKRLCLCLVLWAVAAASAGCVLDARGQSAQGMFSRTLSVTGPVRLEIQTGAGEVLVRPADGGTVTIEGRVSAGWRFWDEDGAEERVREVQRTPPIEQSGNEIHIGRWPRWNNVRISYLVLVPRDTDLQVRTGSGDVEVGDLQGPVSAETGAGEIRIGRVSGEVRVRTGSGDVELVESAGATVRTGSGRIRVRSAGGGRSELTTGSGDVDIENASGPLRVRTGSGRITVVGEPRESWELGAGSGDVSIDVPPAAAFNVDIHTGSGDIAARAVTTVERSTRRELRGAVGAGGPLVSMTTGSGEVRIR